MKTTLRAERLESRDTPALVSAGGYVYGLDDATGATVFKTQLDPGFSGPLFVAGMSDGSFLVGAGVGGGPRVTKFGWAPDGIQGVREEWSIFVGDPNTRTGVSVADWTGYQTAIDFRPATGPGYNPGNRTPGDPTILQRQASKLSPSLERALVATGLTVDVTSAAVNNGAFTYFPTQGVPTIEIPENNPYLYHEFGHVLYLTGPESVRQSWRELYAVTDFGTFSAHDRSDAGEAFAASFKQYLDGHGVGALPAAASAFLDNLFAVNGWER